MESPVHVLMLSIKTVRGLPRLRAPVRNPHLCNKLMGGDSYDSYTDTTILKIYDPTVLYSRLAGAAEGITDNCFTYKPGLNQHSGSHDASRRTAPMRHRSHKRRLFNGCYRLHNA